jgi:uncharacterized protein YjbJ (UPF0337 family)
MKSLTEIEGDWTQTKDKLKQRFGIVTDNDLLNWRWKKNEMLERLQVKLGKTEEEILKIIADL